MYDVIERLVWPLRKLAWRVEEKIIWPMTASGSGLGPANWWVAHWPDVLLAVGLGIAAFLSRRHGLPTEGLWLDDSITGAGLIASSPSDLLVVSAEHPGYTALLAGLSPITGDGDGLAYPALIGGVLGPPLLYVGLRSIGYARAVSLLLGALVVAAQAHLVYSGRVRTYTIDLLIVLAVTLVIPRLTRIRWGWQTAAAWVVITSVLATFSIFAMIGVSAAGVIVLLHPARDLLVRAVAVGAQAILSGLLFLASRATYNGDAHESSNSAQWDTFVEFDPNPIRFGEEILLHLRRLGETLVANPDWLALTFVLVALAGLAVASFRPRPMAIRARLLLLIVAVAFAASLAGKFPFGAALGNTPLSDGHRWSLWLVPVLAVGAATVLQWIRNTLERSRLLCFTFDAGVIAAAVLIVASAGPALKYPFPGKSAAANYVEARLGPADRVLLPFRSDWSFAVEADFDATVAATPQSSIGFRPDFTDPRIMNLELEPDDASWEEKLLESERIFVYYPEHPYSEADENSRADVASTLEELGLHPTTHTFGDATVEVWASDQQARRSRDGLPSGWQRTEAASPSAAPGILDCLGVPSAQAQIRGFTYTGPRSAVVRSDIIEWPEPGKAREALRAFRGPDASTCLKAPVETLIQAPEEVRRVKAPPQAGPAAAFRLTLGITAGSDASPNASAFLLFFTRGDAGILIGTSALGGRQDSPRALKAVIADAEKQVKAPEEG